MALGQSTRRKAGSSGVTFHGPVFTRVDNPGQLFDILDEIYGGNFVARCDERFDFNGSAINTTDGFWTKKIVGTTPTLALVANTANGEVKGALTSTSEAQVGGMFTNDQLFIESSKAFLFQCRVKISGVAASTRFVFGLSSAYNATFDSTTRNVWFRVEGNDLSILTEADDDTTNTDDQDTGRDFVADTYKWLTIDGRDIGTIRYYVGSELVDEIAAGAMSGLMQPVLLHQKDSGTTTGSFTVDYIRLSWDRE